MAKKTEAGSAVIFDFNGVLVWDLPIHEAAWNDFASRRRGSLLTEQEMERNVHGRTNRQILEHIVGRGLTEAEEIQLGDEKESMYRQRCSDLGDDFQLSPGAVELLEALREGGIPYTIATSSGPDNVQFFVERLQLERWFERSLIVFDDGTLPGKPAPDIYLKAATVLAVAPEQCTVIEDALSGIAAARAAGARQIIALGPAHKRNALLEVPGVSRVIESLAEISLDDLA